METRETITLDARAQHRLYVLNHILGGGLTVTEAARVLELSIRQIRRLVERYGTDGAAGLVHGNSGRAPAHRLADELRAHLVALATTTYAGVNRAHLAELLAEREAIDIPERTLRRILVEGGVGVVRRRRPARHRSRRERMPRAGLLLQTDGSRHHWFGRELPLATLVAGIDDATSIVTGGTFRAQEDAVGYFTMLAQTADGFGLPAALYSDRHGIFRAERNRPASLAEQLTGKRSLTQVGRALDDASIAWIGARSPQAKGRVERLWRTLQDRLVVELRLAGITGVEAANAFLPGFFARHNARFASDAADPEQAWRAWPEGLSAESVLCFHYPRRVARDATVSFAAGDLALPRRPDGRTWAGASVTLQERLDGSLWIDHRGSCVPVVAAPLDAGQLRARKLSHREPGQSDSVGPTPARPETASRVTPKPSPHHPWRRSYAPERR